MSDSLPPIEDLIAHRGNMLLLDYIVDFDVESCCTEYTPQADAWYADASGNMPAWIGIELMAQTIAAYIGMQKQSSGLPPKQGVLLGTRSYKASVPHYAAGEPLLIEARVSFRDESGLAAFECRLRRSGDTEEVLSTAMLKVYEPENFDAFMKGKQP